MGGAGSVARVFAHHTRSPGSHPQHDITLGVVILICNSITLGVEAGGSEGQDPLMYRWRLRPTWGCMKHCPKTN